MNEMLANFDKIVAQNDRQSTINTTTGGSDNSLRFVALLQHKRSAATASPATPSSPNNTPTFPTSWVPNGNPDNLEITDVQPLEFARQISLIQSNLFVAIHAREYFQYCAERGGAPGSCWMDAPDVNKENAEQDEDVAPNLHAFARWSRNLGRIAAGDIVKNEAKSKRVAALEKWIEIAHQCLQLKNFDAVFNIMDGIRHPSIERLAETFRGLNASVQRTLESLRQMVSKDADYKHYREAIAQSPPPTLPHFDSMLEEIWFLECSSPKVLSGGIVNFFHYRQIARKVLNYQQSLPSPYLFKPVPALQKLLSRSASELLDDEQLKRKSHAREEPVYY